MTDEAEDKLFILEGMPAVEEEDEFKKLVKEAELEESTLYLPRGYLSVSQVGMYMRCGLQYKYRYVDDVIKPPGVALVEGSAMHKALEVGLIEKMQAGTVTPVDVMLDAWQDSWKQKKTEVEDWGDEGEQKVAETVENRGHTLIKMYHGTHLPERHPTGVEKRFWTMMGDTRTPVLGYIDLVDVETVDQIPGPTVVDHKVVRAAKSQADTDSDMQLTVYAQAIGTPRVRFDSFCKTKKPQIKTTRSMRTTQDYKWVAHVFDTVAQNISKGVFLPADPASWVCSRKFCGYYDSCRGKKR
jgi:hypothetical protein